MVGTSNQSVPEMAIEWTQRNQWKNHLIFAARWTLARDPASPFAWRRSTRTGEVQNSDGFRMDFPLV